MKKLAWSTLAILALLATAGAWWLLPSLPEAPPLAGSLQQDTMEFDGKPRSFSWYLPERVVDGAALVFVLHGSAGDGAQARWSYGYEFDRLADQEGFVVVYPDGYERHWNDCRKHAPYAANTENIDDVGFLSSLVDVFVARYPVDRERVFVTGISNGGQMALRMALEAPQLVAAVAPVIASLPTAANNDCTSAGKPVPVALMNGTEDPMNPYAGGEVALYGLFAARGAVLSTEETMAWFAALAGYAAPTDSRLLPDHDPDDGSRVRETRWTAPGKLPLVLFSVEGGGHTVPHPAVRWPRLLGRTNHDISAAEEIQAFFRLVPQRQRG